MTWVKIDDSLDTHPKVRRAGNEALGIWLRSLTYCNRHLTDGHIDPEWLAERTGRRAVRIAQALVTAGLWDVNSNGWIIHDYLDFNPSREHVLERRAADAARKAERKR